MPSGRRRALLGGDPSRGGRRRALLADNPDLSSYYSMNAAETQIRSKVYRAAKDQEARWA